MMGLKRAMAVVVAAVLVAVLAAPALATGSHGRRHPHRSPELTTLATLGIEPGSGSTIGPGGHLYVTDGTGGRILEVNRHTGDVSVYAEGLPPRSFIPIGGAMDLAFIGRTAYVMVSMVSGEIVGGPSLGDATVGIYRLERDGSFSVVADIGTWSADNPPATDFFITSGVQYSMQRYGWGFLVADGHHNRVLHARLDGEVREIQSFGNIVPTGLAVRGPRIYLGQAGPVPHRPQDGKVVRFTPWSASVTDVGSGASMIVDVEFGPRGALYAVSQGTWDTVEEGSPAFPDTGRLVKVERDGSMTPVVDSSGAEIVLDRPTSLEFVGDTAYVVTLDGEVLRITNVSR